MTMMKTQRTTKAEQAKEWIANEIRIGNFARGTILPSEYELADRAGVSYMTLRKAVGALVAEGLLERAWGSGTYVRSEIPERKLQKILGLAMPAWAAPENLDMLAHYAQACEDAGWILKFTYARSWEDRSILDLWQNCDALVLMVIQEMDRMPAFLLEKFRASAKPIVVNKGDSGPLGKDAVYYTRDARMEEPCDVLHALGHRGILLVDQVTRHDGTLSTIHPITGEFAAIFREKYPDVRFDTESMAFDVPLFRSPHPEIRRSFRERRETVGRHTAVICPMSFYWPVMSGLRDAGLRVPEDMSVLAFGDRQEAEYYCPRPATFSASLRDQAYRTLDRIRWRFEHSGEPPADIHSDSHFHEGETLGPARK